MKNIKLYYLKIFFSFFYIFCTSKNTFAQFIFEGKVSSISTALPLPKVSICLMYHGKITAYTISDELGNYRLKSQENYHNEGAYQLQFTCIGFQKMLINLKPDITVYNVQLYQSTTQLPDIEIKSPLKFVDKNDTLSYDVSSFAQKQDRKIGDVIKKLPGIEILENGRILFNGQAISNFYIDGDDLLGDRYNIANNALPVDMVEKIQILENHQPVKALKQIRNSNDIALNLQLKKDAKLKLHGIVEPGGGFPQKYDAGITSLGFFKKQKFLNVLNANNIGKDVKTEINQLNYKDYLNRIEKDETGRILIPETMYLTPINKNRYFNNNSLLVTLNYLSKIKKDVQVKTNVIYLPENVKFLQQNTTSIFLRNDTINYYEKQYSKSGTQQFTGDVQLNINEKTFFFNNKLSFQKDKSTYTTNIERAKDSIIQGYGNRKIMFSNDLSLLKVIKEKHVLEFFSYLSNASMLENAEWQQGLFPDIINDSTLYLQTIQSVELPTFFMNNYFSYSNRYGKHFVQTYKAGFLYQQQKLETGIGLLQPGGNITNPADSFSNNFAWHKSKSYFILLNDWSNGNFKINFKIPVNYFRLMLSNLVTDKFFLNPQLYVRYNLGVENSLSLNASVNNNFGNIQSVYQGYVLKNYRTIEANSGLLEEQKLRNVSVGFNFRKSVKILFANILLGYSNIESNTITANTVNGFLDRKILLPILNSQKSWFVNTGVSKYLFKYGTTVGIKSGFQRGSLVQLLNNELQIFYSNSFNTSFSLSYKKSNWFNFNYKTAFNVNVSNPYKNISIQSNAKKLKLFLIQQNFEYILYLFENSQIKLTADQFYSDNKMSQIKSNTWFADFSLRYKFVKLRTDVELLCNNIFNKREFSNLVLFSNTIIESKIVLNPRMFIAKFSFSF